MLQLPCAKKPRFPIINQSPIKQLNDKVDSIIDEGHNELDKIKTLFITGGAGFIGSNFINYFCKKYKNIKVINFDALYYCGKIENIDKDIRASENYTFIQGILNHLIC